ncbi:Y-family DNA polymerase [Hyphococcus sp.]|uniref:Y-family DNA polymerase n=1 Tax=Hyphococcus sp. TaxID=2038636 RepID=UPI00208B08B2|nr:MAG: hypothetical protein DHS20C04_12590 [Marinicaulis sp.]
MLEDADISIAPLCGLESDRPLAYLFIDFNAYFAGVEQHDHPELRDRPVIVTPLNSEHTSAIAASYEARRYGIGRGTKVRDARRLCPGIAVMPARHDRYVVVHRLLMAEIERHLPLEKVYSVDEAAFKLSRSERDPVVAVKTAKRVMDGIVRNIGPSLRASIGLAPTRLLAKLAAERVKPDGLTVLTMADLPHRLADMPLTDIPGVGAGISARLSRANVNAFLDLWSLQPKQARAIWGSVVGERFWYGLHGYETVEEPTKKSMIGHSRVLTREHEEPAKARIVARALVLKAASRLRHYKMFASTLSLSIRLRPEGGWQSVHRFSHTQDSFLLLHSLEKIWRDFLQQQSRDNNHRRIGGVTVYLHGLAKPGETSIDQLDFFDTQQCKSRGVRRESLWTAIDAINSDPDAKFSRLGGSAAVSNGKRHVGLASQSGLSLDYLGAKIAFSRVPDDVEFLY